MKIRDKINSGNWSLKKLMKDSSASSHEKLLNELKEYLSSRNTIENLADLEHQQWAHWTNYFIKEIEKALAKIMYPPNDVCENGKVALDELIKKLTHWKEQANTEYLDLSEEDKEKDRKWARIVINKLEEEKLVDHESDFIQSLKLAHEAIENVDDLTKLEELEELEKLTGEEE